MKGRFCRKIGTLVAPLSRVTPRTLQAMPFADATSYKVPFEEPSGETQLWPVTPYQITARSEASAQKCFAHLFVDGQKVDQSFLSPGTTINFKGIPAERGATRELLFSLPRYATRDEKLRGTIC